MNYIGLSTCDTANGPGVRVSLFSSFETGRSHV